MRRDQRNKGKMPRKRQVKKVRCVPEVPEGDEGKDLTKEEQQQKLQVFLADFDRKCMKSIVYLFLLIFILFYLSLSWVNQLFYVRLEWINLLHRTVARDFSSSLDEFEDVFFLKWLIQQKKNSGQKLNFWGFYSCLNIEQFF